MSTITDAFNQAAADTGGTLSNTGQDTSLFDGSLYEREDLKLPKADGKNQQRIAVKFTGTVYLDRMDPTDVALYRDLEGGRNVRLMIEAWSGGVAVAFQQDAEGNLEEVTGARALKVHTVYRPDSR